MVENKIFDIFRKTGYSYNDLTMVPAIISDIDSRSQCNPLITDELAGIDNMLPIFGSPMSTITNMQNIDIWKKNKITPVIPRNINIYDRLLRMLQNDDWIALSLNEFKKYFIEHAETEFPKHGGTYRVCIDLANGHMRSLYETINVAKALAKENGYNLVIMTGNIANPETYRWICENAEVDYIRLSIGTGNNCITSTQSSIHYPIASLIRECYAIKRDIIKTPDTPEYKGLIAPYVNWKQGIGCHSCPKIIADGGIRGYADVIKAIGLGADYVMIGSLLTGLLESAAPLNIECYNSHYKYSFKDDGTVNDGIKDILNIWESWSIDEEFVRREFIHDMKDITKESYGMSTKKAQLLINPNAKTKTSEGCTKYIKVKETVKQWSENMCDYMKSAMSYTNKRTVDEFLGNVDFIVNTNCAIMAVNK